MKRFFPTSIFGRILLATLLPLTLIFSIVLITIAQSTFHATTEATQQKMLAFAQHSAEQIRGSLLNSSRLIMVAAYALDPMADDSDSARENALQFMERIFENASNAHRIRMYFDPAEGAFGKYRIFAYELSREKGAAIWRPLASGAGSDLDLSLPQYAVPLKEGISYHRSIVTKHFGPGESPAYLASTNYPVIRNGKVIGCVGMDLLYRKSFPLLDQWQTDGSHPFLARDDGTILYAADTSLVGRNIDSLGFNPDFLENIRVAMRQETSFVGEVLSPVSGKQSLFCVYPVGLEPGRSRLFLCIGTPTELVYSGAMASVRTVFLSFLIGMLIFAGSLFAVTRNIMRPIKKLTESAKLIANGQLEEALVELDELDERRKTRDEVYRLRHSLRIMVKKLIHNTQFESIAIKAKHEKMEMEEAAAAKNRFFANMSHEIRTPMNVILGMSEILLMENLTHDQRKFIEDIKVSSESLLNIINDILDLSRLESGKLSLVPVQYDFRMLMENIHSLSTYLAEKKGLDFRIETIGNTPDYLYGDDGRLRQVLLNVIGNAIKFTEKGGVTLIIADEGETLRFDVVDTGIGIREEDRQYLFEPFRQIDGPQSRTAKGTGLGLSICLNLVELMGGTIICDSAHGKGSSFHITIPKVLGDGDKVEKKMEKLPISFDPAARVLVVDDSESNLKVAREFLKVFGITARTASSGQEAVAMAAESDFDLIFMDHMMPGMDGVETTHRIRALGERQAGLPIVALTANAVIGTRERLLASGINDFLPKPIEKVKFQAILAKWLPENMVLRKGNVPGSRIDLHAAGTTKKNGKTNCHEAKNHGSRTGRGLAKISRVKDLDISLGLSRMAGNLELYKELLGMIVENIPEALAKIDAALSKGDAVNLNIETHTLKGSLANLGAGILANKAAELERLGNQEDFVLFTEQLEPFRQDLENFARALQKELATEGEEAQPAAPGGRTRLADALSELRAALANFDHEKSMSISAGLARFDWGEAQNSGIKTVSARIRHFDYDAAMSELERSFPEAKS